jgi:hypothetical protein
MKKHSCLLFTTIFLILSTVFLCELSTAIQFESSWKNRAPMYQARAYSGVAEINGTIYAIGGDKGVIVELLPSVDLSFNFVNTNEQYDPMYDNWAIKTPMPSYRALLGTAVYQNKIYCLGGYEGTGKITGLNQVYDPTENTWKTKSPIPIPMYGVQANIIYDQIYVNGINSRNVYAYSPREDNWTLKTTAPYAIVGRVSAVSENKLYLLGVTTNSSEVASEFCIQTYDIIADTWVIASIPKQTVDSLPLSTYYSSIGLSGGATTGSNSIMYLFGPNETIIFDPSSNTWNTDQPIPSYRICASTANINGSLYVIGGRQNQQWGDPRLQHSGEFPIADIEQYVPPPVAAAKSIIPSNQNQANRSNDETVTYIFASFILLMAALAGIATYLKRRGDNSINRKESMPEI